MQFFAFQEELVDRRSSKIIRALGAELSKLFMMKRAFPFDWFNVITDKVLFPLTVFGIAIMADVWMGREAIPFFNPFPYFFPGHDAAFRGAFKAFKNAARLEAEYKAIA